MAARKPGAPSRRGSAKRASPSGGEQPGHQVGEGDGVLVLVEHVGGEDEVEGSQVLYIRRTPVEEGRMGFAAQVGAGVVGGEIQGGFVVVRGQYRGAAGEGYDGGQPDATPELDGAGTGEVARREVAGEGEGAGPQFRPVGEPLVAVEVFLVDQVVSRDGVQEPVSYVANLDCRLGQARAATQVGLEPIKGRPGGR